MVLNFYTIIEMLYIIHENIFKIPAIEAYLKLLFIYLFMDGEVIQAGRPLALCPFSAQSVRTSPTPSHMTIQST